MNVTGKTNDNEKARRDLRLHCKQKDLELKVQDNGKILKPFEKAKLKQMGPS